MELASGLQVPLFGQRANAKRGKSSQTVFGRRSFSATYYGIADYAQFVGRNYDEAVRLARQGIRQFGDFVGAHRVLTTAAGMAGRRDAAAAPLHELRRVQPNISLAWRAQPNTNQTGCRAGALPGRLPSNWAELA
jgi:hypothetical protein